MFSDLYIRLRSLFRRGAVESELDEELRFHFERQVEKYVAMGVSRCEEARCGGLGLEFGAGAGEGGLLAGARGFVCGDAAGRTWGMGCGCFGGVRGLRRWWCLRWRWGSAPILLFSA